MATDQAAIETKGVQPDRPVKSGTPGADNDEPILTPENVGEGSLANDDGSVAETLDTAFHHKPGYTDEHSEAGSNRSVYYEANSQGESDADEETDFIWGDENK